MTGPEGDVVDVLIVGAGPAGLTAALYAARSRRTTLVVHDGASRALRIPRTWNLPGHPKGVVGAEMIASMTRHAERCGARVETARIAHAARDGDLFALTAEDGRRFRARALILATGVTLSQIPMDPALHEAAIGAGVLRYCPICDGFEHVGLRIAVIGADAHGAAEALFLRTYTDRLTLIPRDAPALTPDERAAVEAAGVEIVHSPVTGFEIGEASMKVHLEDRAQPLIFDVVYPGLGVRPRSELAVALGVPVTPAGCAPGDAMRETVVPGLWIAGDVLEGLDQIATAIGQGAQAAVRAHNWLRGRDGETLQAKVAAETAAGSGATG